jgi:hypothetical protein
MNGRHLARVLVFLRFSQRFKKYGHNQGLLTPGASLACPQGNNPAKHEAPVWVNPTGSRVASPEITADNSPGMR